MKSERILYALTGVREDFIEQAYPEQVKSRPAWAKYACAAACLCLVLAGVLAWAAGRGAESAASGLPVIDIPELGVGGMGFEGYMYYNASEIENGSPWREDMVFETMPVFKNGAYDPTHAGIPRGLDEAEITRRLENAAAALGVEILETSVEREIQEKGSAEGCGAVVSIGARTEIGTIRAYANGEVGYDLWSNYPWNLEHGLEPVELPEQYSFTHHDTTREQALEALRYLTETYAELLDFEEPAFIVSGDYNIYGEYGRDYDVYDASGDDLQDLLNYSFCRTSFCPDDEGRFSGIWLHDDLSVLEKIGDYPIISIDEARERLVAGQYQTSVPYELPGEEYIAKVELMYRSSPLEELSLPYYRFYVELPEMESVGGELGLKHFGAYYVPAIESEYIGNAEIYHGQFN